MRLREHDDDFFAMVRDHQERYDASTTRYSTQPFYRRQLGEDFAGANLERRIYPSFEEAAGALAGAAVDSGAGVRSTTAAPSSGQSRTGRGSPD
jgi:hypothetical protein